MNEEESSDPIEYHHDHHQYHADQYDQQQQQYHARDDDDQHQQYQGQGQQGQQRQTIMGEEQQRGGGGGLDICDDEEHLHETLSLSQQQEEGHEEEGHEEEDHVNSMISTTGTGTATNTATSMAVDHGPLLFDSSQLHPSQDMDKELFPATTAAVITSASAGSMTLESLQQENEALKQENHALGMQVHQLGIEMNELHKKLSHVEEEDDHKEEGDGVASLDATGAVAEAAAAAAAQLSNYQSALTLSETQKSQLLHENHMLRERCIQAGIPIDDVVVSSSMGVVMTAAASAASAASASAVPSIGAAGTGTGIEPAAAQEQQPQPQQSCTSAGSQPQDGGRTERTGEKTSRSQEKWESHFERLVQYQKDHGNCLVPTSTELGRWLCRQRHNFKYKSLKEDRKQRLMALDKTCLGERVVELSVYSAAAVDKGSDGGGGGGGGGENEGDNSIRNGGGGVGVNGNGDGNPMDSMTGENGQEGSLAELGESHPETTRTPTPALLMNAKTKYNYAYETKLHAKWNRFFKQLEEYKAENGHCNYPTMNGSLGRWISRQRTLYRSKKLKADRYEKLMSIGFMFEDATALEFRGKLDQQWDDMYSRLVEHKESKGHCFDVPENLPLGKWLYRQRWLYRHGNLRKDRADKLLAIGFEDKKVLKRAVEEDDDGMSGGGQFLKKKRKVDDVNNTNDYEPGPFGEDEALEHFDVDDAQLKGEKGNDASPSCGGIASV